MPLRLFEGGIRRPCRADRHARPAPARDADDAALLLHRCAAGRARQAGTDGDPGQAPRGCGHRARGDGRRRLRPPRDLGSRDVARAAARKPKGARKMLPSVLPTETDHVPVLADEVLDRLAPQAGRDGRRLHVRLGRALRAARRAPARRGQADRDRPRSDGRAVLRAAAARDRGQGAPAARRVLAGARAARRERRPRRRDPARPRRLLDAARPARARLLVRRRRAARHAHGSSRRPDCGATSSTRPASGSSQTSSAATARSATRGRSPGRSCGAAQSSRSSGRATSSR